MFLSIGVFLLNIIVGSFFLNLALAIGALVFTLRCNLQYFKTLNT